MHVLAAPPWHCSIVLPAHVLRPPATQDVAPDLILDAVKTTFKTELTLNV